MFMQMREYPERADKEISHGEDDAKHGAER
jgi:hypothetical protein